MEFCYITKGFYNDDFPNKVFVIIGLTREEGLVSPVAGPSGNPSFNSLYEAKNFILNRVLEKAHPRYPSIQYNIYFRAASLDATLVQPVNETVGGLPVQKKFFETDFSYRLPIMYDEVSVLQGIKLIHVIDKRNRDFVDFGIPFITNFFAWLFNIDL